MFDGYINTNTNINANINISLPQAGAREATTLATGSKMMAVNRCLSENPYQPLSESEKHNLCSSKYEHVSSFNVLSTPLVHAAGARAYTSIRLLNSCQCFRHIHQGHTCGLLGRSRHDTGRLFTDNMHAQIVDTRTLKCMQSAKTARIPKINMARMSNQR